jgi:ribose/xylose/arabinose/galactoside ABC-type transport system permease subunit
MKKISGILMLLIYVCVATTLLNEAFVSAYNMQNIARWSALFGIIGIGVAFVIITGGIDLSIGSVIGLVGCLLPMLMSQYRWSVPTSLLAVMIVALAIGLIHGLLITKMKLQPFVVTLCGLLVYRGLARWITGDQTQGFGTQYDNTLRLIATGKPCSVAFVILVVGAVMAVWSLWRLVKEMNSPTYEQRLGTNLFGAIAGLVLAGIGSSRFWYGFEFEKGSAVTSLGGWNLTTWQLNIPEAGARLPGELMWWVGLLFVPAAIWFLVAAMRGDWRKTIGPLVAVGVAAALLAGAIWIVGQPDNWFFPNEQWADRWRMAAVFLSLGLFMGTLAWFAQSGLNTGGEAARLPLLVASTTAVLWLVGKTFVVRRLVSDWSAAESLDWLLGKTSIGETLVPAPFFVLMALGAAASVFLNMTIYGRYLLALGRNEEAARYSGIKTDGMVILAYVICAGAAGLGGILFALDGNSVQPSGHGSFYELYAIAAAVLGGCSLRGGEGSILGVVIGAAVMRVLYNSINLLGIPSQLEFAIIGDVILIGVLVDELVKRLAARRRALHEAEIAEEARAKVATLDRTRQMPS